MPVHNVQTKKNDELVFLEAIASMNLSCADICMYGHADVHLHAYRRVCICALSSALTASAFSFPPPRKSLSTCLVCVFLLACLALLALRLFPLLP